MGINSKEQAIQRFKGIQNGSGVDRTQFPDVLKGSVSRNLWDETEFSLGIEYGYLIALKELYDITLEELGWTSEDIVKRGA